MPISRRILQRWQLLALAAFTLMGANSAAAQNGAASVLRQESLRVGDVVRIKIWREPDLSGDFPIPADGKVVFPKLGTYELLNETPVSLRERLVKDYSETLVNPSIDVNVLYRINVLGAVRNPGLFTVDATTAVTDVIALAGGVNPDGDGRHVQIIREGKVIATQVDQNMPIARNLIRSGDQVYVPQRSWLARNSVPIVAATITASVYVVTTLLRR